jgi:endonuclease/exonuclease/phosphatase family metal-dependent hydrolase
MKASGCRRTARGLVWISLSLLALLLGGGLVLLAIEWRPAPVLDTPVEGRAAQDSPAASLRLLTWNIGYAGLDDGADFFMDGGRMVRPPSAERVRQNLAGIREVLRRHAGFDLLLLQEVDRDSSRTFGIDEAKEIAADLPGFAWSFAPNYRSPWVPWPLLRPIGRVESGLLSLSRRPVSSARRLQLPGAFPWPVRVFHLKRCLHELRLPAGDGRDWVVVNLHLSTFDRDGRLRRQEMAYLRERLIRLAQDGAYVIAAGDFNQVFPGVDEARFGHADPVPDWRIAVDPDWLPPGFRWAFDGERPSLRAVNRPWRPGQNFVTVIDGFLLGPGVEAAEVRTLDLGFRHSDHHPVLLEARRAREMPGD